MGTGTKLGWTMAVLGLGIMTAGASMSQNNNPYQAISERNSFQLKTPEVRKTEPAPKPKAATDVVLTGITDLGGKRRALLEISSPGQAVQKPVLSEGDSLGTIQVLKIDVPQGEVRLTIDGVESTLSFRRPKPVAGPRTAALLPWGELPWEASLNGQTLVWR